MAKCKSACSSTIIALFPLNSNNDRPNRRATVAFTSRPTAVDPVKETSALRLSATISFTILLSSVMISEKIPQ
ncbi:MAG: hypothetical protein ACD_46C00010G0004 [uncultured bacterium]|nr:MAG: hypothetical protein ACD_46C00010G0004 [uncultured bacterium]